MTREEMIGRIRDLEDETCNLQQLICYLLRKSELLRQGLHFQKMAEPQNK